MNTMVILEADFEPHNAQSMPGALAELNDRLERYLSNALGSDLPGVGTLLGNLAGYVFLWHKRIYRAFYDLRHQRVDDAGVRSWYGGVGASFERLALSINVGMCMPANRRFCKRPNLLGRRSWSWTRFSDKAFGPLPVPQGGRTDATSSSSPIAQHRATSPSPQLSGAT